MVAEVIVAPYGSQLPHLRQFSMQGFLSRYRVGEVLVILKDNGGPLQPIARTPGWPCNGVNKQESDQEPWCQTHHPSGFAPPTWRIDRC